MNRISLHRALRSLKASSIPKHNGLCAVSRNFSTVSRTSILNAPPRIFGGRVLPPRLLRESSSASEVPEGDALVVPEEDIFPLEHPPSSSEPDESVDVKDRLVVLPTSQGTVFHPFGKVWLRDNCQCSKCVHPDTRQRMVDTFSIPKDISVKDIKRAEHVKVEWSDGHIGEYPFRWLAAHNYRKKPYVDRSRALQFRKFKQYTPAVEYPTVSYSDVMAGDEGVMMWLQNIYDWGFCFVKDTPVDPESTEALLKRIAFIRHTHYGGFWDFTADLTYKDTAYTTETLGAHTDNTYFTDPARLQLFHLLSHTGGEGGASLLVDGFKAAQTLLEENQDHARALMSTRHPYHASGNEDVCIQPVEQYPVLKTHSQMRGQLYQIRWNNYDRATKSDWWFDEQERWYEAAGHFNEIIHRSNMEIWTQLEPGTVLIFDNWRMLHGRSEFTGKRRMCGGYINNDDFISRYRLLKFGRENVLQQLGNVKGNPKNPFSFV